MVVWWSQSEGQGNLGKHVSAILAENQARTEVSSVIVATQNSVEIID